MSVPAPQPVMTLAISPSYSCRVLPQYLRCENRGFAWWDEFTKRGPLLIESRGPVKTVQAFSQPKCSPSSVDPHEGDKILIFQKNLRS